MGGTKRVLEVARSSYDAGEYRWVATLLNNLVFAQPDNGEARELLAKTYDQLGYQAESGPWRNFYLTGALELRQGANKVVYPLNVSAQVLDMTGLEELLDLLAVQIDGEKAAGKEMAINLNFKDRGENASLILKNGALTNRIGYQIPDATANIAIDKIDFIKVMLGEASLEVLVRENKAEIEGMVTILSDLKSVTSPADKYFNIVEP